MAINWNLLQPTNMGQALTGGFQQGREMRSEMETGAALAALANNPDDPEIVKRLAQWNPQAALKIGDQQRGRAAAAHERDLTGRALTGDKEAMNQLAGINPELWMKIDDGVRKQAEGRVKYIGQAALRISTLPPEQRAAAWDAAIDSGVTSYGYSDLAQYRGQYSDQALNSVLAQSGLVSEALGLGKPEMFNVGPGEGRYSRNPYTGEVTTIIQPNAGDGEFGDATIPPPPPGVVVQGGQGAGNFNASGPAGAVASALSGYGYSRPVIAGLLGNWDVESSWNPRGVGDSGTAFGYGQWRHDRARNFQSVTGVHPSRATPEQSARFFKWEMDNPGKAGMKKFWRDRILASKTPEEAAYWIDEYYERSDGTHRGKRQKRARKYYGR